MTELQIITIGFIIISLVVLVSVILGIRSVASPFTSAESSVEQFLFGTPAN